MPSFDRFTPNARLSLQIAEQESKNINASAIGTQHLLLALLSIPKSLGFSIFTGAGVTQENVRILMKSLGERKDIEGGDIQHGLTSDLHTVIEQSVVIASKFKHPNVGTEHLVYALVSSGKNMATEILEQMQVEPADLKAHIEEMFGQINDFKEDAHNLEDSLDSLFQGLQGAIIGGMSAEPEGLKRRRSTANGEQKSKTPALDYFTDNLNKKVKENKLDPIIGRDEEIERIVHILNRKTKNNPVLIGEPGVGKTAIIEGLAQRIEEGSVPPGLRGKEIRVLNMGSLIAGTKYRGEFEQRFDDIIKEAVEMENNIILFIDEIHTIIGSGSAEGSLDGANILKPALGRGALQLIGATTLNEYKTIEKDRALERRFQTIMVEEPSTEDAIQILEGLKESFEEYHNISISAEAVAASVKLSKRYINDRYLPDKAIDLIDEAAAGKSLAGMAPDPALKKLDEQLERLVVEQQAAIRNQKYQKALTLKQQQQDLEDKKKKLHTHGDGDKRSPITLTEDDITTVIARMTGIPVTRLLKTETKRLQGLETVLRKSVVGQNEAIEKVAKAIRRSRVGISHEDRPIGSFLFLGPTGVGKTELVRTIAKEIFNREDALIKIDMSEFMERHNVSRLTGTTAGYVGYEDGGQLTEQVRRKPYSVVLFDEIEKAHPDFFNVLLQIMEDGNLTDGAGKKVDFSNTIIVMTSNIGADKLTKQAATIGFQTGDKETNEQKEYDAKCAEVMAELKDNFRPEFINRIDHTVIFNALNQKDIRKIVKMHVDDLGRRLKDKNITLQAGIPVLDHLAQRGFDPEYGARPVRRVIQNELEDLVAEEMLKGIFKEGDTVNVKLHKDKLSLEHAVKKTTTKPKKKDKVEK